MRYEADRTASVLTVSAQADALVDMPVDKLSMEGHNVNALVWRTGRPARIECFTIRGDATRASTTADQPNARRSTREQERSSDPVSTEAGNSIHLVSATIRGRRCANRRRQR